MKHLYVSSKEVKKESVDKPIDMVEISPEKPQASIKGNRVNVFNKFLEWYERKSWPVKILLFGVLIGLILGIAGITYYIILINEGKKEPIQLKNTLVSAEFSGRYYSSNYTFLEKPYIPRDAENPINGELYTQDEMKEIKKNPPLAVMIENHTSARPQSGLDKADIVYEALAEGGITRFMGIYWGKSAKELGPIRSARQYYLELLSPYDAIYMHIGGASSSNPKTNALGNIYLYGIHDLDRAGSFYRIKERKAPHNAYSSTDILWGMAKKFGWSEYDEPKAWKFKRDATVDDRGESTTAKIRFLNDIANGGAYDVNWAYNNKTNLYYRSNGGLAHKDKVSGLQYTSKNVIIQEVKFSFAGGGKGHVIYDIIGSGNAKILLDGKVIEATWSKSDRKGRTIFKDKSGKEIEFNRGQIWVEVVPKGWGTVTITQ